MPKRKNRYVKRWIQVRLNSAPAVTIPGAALYRVVYGLVLGRICYPFCVVKGEQCPVYCDDGHPSSVLRKRPDAPLFILLPELPYPMKFTPKETADADPENGDDTDHHPPDRVPGEHP